MRDWDEVLPLLDIARTNSEGDVHAACPVHGGSDSLHATMKNGKALLKCFGCDAKPKEIIAALEEAAQTTEPTPMVVNRVSTADTEESPSERVIEPQDSAHTDMSELDWYARYCGVPRELIESLGVEGRDGWVLHTWPDTKVTKDRKVDSKDRRWTPKGGAQPKMWPVVPDDLPEEIWLCEGESDVIVLRASGVKHAYTAGSASQPLTPREMRALHARGVDRVIICYDTDRVGQKAAQETLEAAQEGGLIGIIASLGDPLNVPYKDLRERWLAGNEEPPGTTADDAVDSIYGMEEIEPSIEEDLLLGRLHSEDHTVLFGDGGTGKGVVAAQWAADLTNDYDYRVLILDYEAHAKHEWRPRLEAFGAKLKQIKLMQPDAAVWDIAGAVKQACKLHKIDYVIIDSATYACVGEEVEKSATAAKYSLAIAQFGMPVLTLAHTTKSDIAAKHPFGSVFWSNGARCTINVAKDEDNEDNRIMTNPKTNQQAPFPSANIDWSWVHSGLPTKLKESANHTVDLEVAIIEYLEHHQTVSARDIRLEMINLSLWDDTAYANGADAFKKHVLKAMTRKRKIVDLGVQGTSTMYGPRQAPQAWTVNRVSRSPQEDPSASPSP